MNTGLERERKRKKKKSDVHRRAKLPESKNPFNSLNLRVWHQEVLGLPGFMATAAIPTAQQLPKSKSSLQKVVVAVLRGVLLKGLRQANARACGWPTCARFRKLPTHNLQPRVTNLLLDEL